MKKPRRLSLRRLPKILGNCPPAATQIMRRSMSSPETYRMFCTRHRISCIIFVSIVMTGFSCDARPRSATSQPAATSQVAEFRLGDAFAEDLPIEFFFPQTEDVAPPSEHANPGGERFVVKRMLLMPESDAHHYIRVVLDGAMLTPRVIPSKSESSFLTTTSSGLVSVWKFDRVPAYPNRYSCILRQLSKDGKPRIQVAIGLGGFYLVQERDQPVVRYRGLEMMYWFELFSALENVPRETIRAKTTQQ